MKIETIQLYEDRKDVVLTGYVLDDLSATENGTRKPAIIICPGGAYLSLSKNEAEPVAIRFAAMGYHAFVLKYSVYAEEKSDEFPDLSKPLIPKESSQYPNPVLNIGKAMLTIREKADEWMIDTDRIGVCGFSAGAHNAAMYATTWQTDLFTNHFNVASELFKPAVCILGYALVDYPFMYEFSCKLGSMPKVMNDAANVSYLGTATPSPEQLELVSPNLHVTAHMPPTFLWATATDDLVPVQHSIRMAHALADEGIPFELHIFEKGQHGLSIATQASASAKSWINPDVAKWVDLCEAWLLKRMELDLPERTIFG